MFEYYNVPYLYIANTAILALYAAGTTSGLVVDLGHTSSWVVPVYDSRVVKEGVYKNYTGGRDIT